MSKASQSTRPPKYSKHKATGQAVVSLPIGKGKRHDIYLGTYGTKEAWERYTRVVAEWQHGRRIAPAGGRVHDITVNELMEKFMAEAATYYRHSDGRQTSEFRDYKLSLRPLKRLYGHTLATEFDPPALETLQQEMIVAGLSRGVINQRINRIRRMFRWAVKRMLIPTAVADALQKVDPLKPGRSAARETEPIRPVPLAIVEQTLPHMSATVAAMVRVQRLAAMRPGEVVVMRAIDLDMTEGDVWIYQPGSHLRHGQHKTAWRGHSRVIFLGPQATKILQPFLRTELQAYLFSPAETVAGIRAEKRRLRRTRVQPSQLSRAKRQPEVFPGQRYSVDSYEKAIDRACDRAFPPPEPLARREGETIKKWRARLTVKQRDELREWQRLHRWAPNRLRKRQATDVQRGENLEAARIYLGHKDPKVTLIYAEADKDKGIEIARKYG